MLASAERNMQLILGLRVRQRRTDLGLSLTETARTAGLSVSYLSEIEKGKKHPRLDKVMDLARALEINPEDLVSLRPDRDPDPVSAALGSRLIRAFPFHLFGVEPSGLFDLADDPARAAALLRTFLDVGRTYDIQVEDFLLAALRSHQERHHNHFEDLEQEAAAFRAHRGLGPETPIEAEQLREILEREHGYEIDEDILPTSDQLRSFRWVYKEGTRPRLFVNGGLLPSQRAFVYAYELGFLHLGLEARASASSWLEIESFEQLLDNFKASYFAGALLMPEDAVTRDLEGWLSLPGWDGQALLDLVEKHRATPEMFLYRLAQVTPKRLGLEEMFFFRFNHRPGSDEFRPTRVLNLSRVPVPHGVGLDEHHCRRWPAMQLLRDMESAPASTGPVIKAQRSVFLDDGHEFLVVSIARPLVLSAVNACVSIGFLLDDKAREKIAWCDDRAFPRVDVHLSCERCPLSPDACGDRAAPPRVHDALRDRATRLANLNDFLDDLDSPTPLARR